MGTVIAKERLQRLKQSHVDGRLNHVWGTLHEFAALLSLRSVPLAAPNPKIGSQRQAHIEMTL